MSLSLSGTDQQVLEVLGDVDQGLKRIVGEKSEMPGMQDVIP